MCHHEFVLSSDVHDYLYCHRCGTYQSAAPEDPGSYWSEHHLYEQAWNVDMHMGQRIGCPAKRSSTATALGHMGQRQFSGIAETFSLFAYSTRRRAACQRGFNPVRALAAGELVRATDQEITGGR